MSLIESGSHQFQLRQFAIHVSQLDRAVDFYSKLLGRAPIAKFPQAGLAFFLLGSVRLLLDANLAKSSDSSSLIYLQVADVQSVVAEIRNLDIEIHTEPHVVFEDAEGLFDVPGREWLAFIRDSEGNLIGLMSRNQD